MSFTGSIREKDLKQLERFHRELDIIAEGYQAQALNFKGIEGNWQR